MKTGAYGVLASVCDALPQKRRRRSGADVVGSGRGRPAVAGFDHVRSVLSCTYLLDDKQTDARAQGWLLLGY